jgi:hypothetical protein
MEPESIKLSASPVTILLAIAPKEITTTPFVAVEDEGERFCSAFSKMLGTDFVKSPEERREAVANSVSAALLIDRNHGLDAERLN